MNGSWSAGAAPAVTSTWASAFGYAAASFVLPCTVALIAARRISGYSRRFDPLIRFGAAFVPAIFGILGRTRGVQYGRGGPFIIVSNHVNVFDGFILRGYLPVSSPLLAMELSSHFTWPLYGVATRLYGNIPVPHRAPRAAMKSLLRAQRMLARGVSLLVLPEGHRTRTGTLQRFMSGPFRLAREAGMPILPVVMVGAYNRKRAGHPRIHPGIVELRIGKPITVDEIQGMDERTLRAMVHDRMRTMLEPKTMGIH